MKKVVSILLILCCLMPATAGAVDVWTNADSDVYKTKMGGMLGRGFINILTCWVDVIVATVEGTKSGPPVIGTVTGLGKGIGCTALRVLSGALDVVSFWVPGFNGYGVCKSYADCINCEPKQQYVPMAVAPQSAIVQAPAPVIAPAEESPMKYIKK